MTKIDLGDGPPLDLETLMTTRLLVQGSSGSGKTFLLKRLLEESAGEVQQAIVDPEGEFAYLASALGHSVIDAERHFGDLPALAYAARRDRVSVVLDLSNLDPDQQVAATGAFLSAFFATERSTWHPCLVVVDEAHLFASGEMAGTKLAKATAATAMANLMCRGRKRGLAGIIATQRVAKIQKNVVAEALNFLVGRTFLDIDLSRTTNLLGLSRDKASLFRELDRGQFVAFGPALSLTPATVSVGKILAPVRPRTDDLLAPLSVASHPQAEPTAAPTLAPRRLPEPLHSLLAWLRDRETARQPWLDYLAAASAVPGILNSVHARRLVDALSAQGYLRVVDGAAGPAVLLLRD